MNIIWEKFNGELAITFLLDSTIDSIISMEAHADLLKVRGDIPSDWSCVAVNAEWKESEWSHECYRWRNKKIIIDLEAAKNETKTRLRKERNPLWNDLDVAYFKVIEAAGDATMVISEKQRLRDVTKLADKATTLEELMGLKV